MSDERQEFERWFTNGQVNLMRDPRVPDDYYSCDASLAWKAWKAARAPLLERIKELEDKIVLKDQALKKVDIVTRLKSARNVIWY